MNPIVIAAILFLCMLGGALGVMRLRENLPEHHMTKETEDVVRLTAGTLATLTALTVGLLIASAKSSFDTKNNELTQSAANLVLVDRQLSRYGPETKEARDLLRRYVVWRIDATWPQESSHPVEKRDGWRLLEEVQDRVQTLTPVNDPQRRLQARALEVSGDVAHFRWLLDVQRASSISAPFLLILVFWLIIIFASFGLFAPRNGTATVSIVVCALSIAGAIFLILEMDQPFEGLIYFSSSPMREALTQLGR
jgi:hypothetical protein